MADEWEKYAVAEDDEWEQYAEAAAPVEAEKKTGFWPSVSEAASKRGSNIADIYSRNVPASDTFMDSVNKAPERILQTVGQGAGLVNDVAFQGLRSAYRNLVPDVAQEAVSSGLEYVGENTPEFLKVSAKGVGDAYDWMKEEYPEGMRDVEAVGNIVGAIPILKGAGAVFKSATKGAATLGRGASTVAKEAVGTATGAGPGFVEEMKRGGIAAQKAMRGEITGEEIVGHAKEALGKVRDIRSEEYLKKFDAIKVNKSELDSVRSGIKTKLDDLIGSEKFDLGVTIGKEGKPIVDFSKSTIVEHQKVVERAIEDIATWTDNTPRGLDTLKKRLQTYVDQSGKGTPANSFVTQLRNDLSNGLKKAVPEYEEMTKGYKEASDLIKDIESNLMLRKDGMSGRITADQTLRRLSSAFRENFEMRKDLLRALGNESGMDIPGEVAGYAATQWIPRGMVGKSVAIGGGYTLSLFNPALWPIIAASSPRVVGEFLNTYGKAMKVLKGGFKSNTINTSKKGFMANSTKGVRGAKQFIKNTNKRP